MNNTLVLKTYPGMGRGVFSTIPIRCGAIVEVAPVIPLTAADWKLIKNTALRAYVFAWGKTGRSSAMPLGYGGLFNHSDDPNMTFWLNMRQRWITFRATRDIPISEQLTIDYMWSKKDRKKHRIPAPE
jgi:SET domain-containing protein